APNSRAIMAAVSSSSVLLIVIMRRRSISFFRTSFALTSSFVARSATVMPSASVIVRVTGGGAVCEGAGGAIRGTTSRRAPGRGLEGRCIGGRYGGAMPGRGGVAGRTGCDGSGRGPPMAVLGRGGGG